MSTKGTVKVRERRDQGSGQSAWPPGADPKEHGILGDSPALLSAISAAYGAAQQGYRVVIHGETGTGKELVAHYIHKCSGRKGALHILVRTPGMTRPTMTIPAPHLLTCSSTLTI